jgi:hypothetical protein
MEGLSGIMQNPGLDFSGFLGGLIEKRWVM